MSALECAAGFPIGSIPAAPVGSPAGEEPLAALEAVVADAVRRTPCCVAFSGGVDSSLVLAATVRSARAQGCPPPVAVSLRYPPAMVRDEATWQRSVLEHLGAPEQVSIPIAGELDFVGDFATEQLLRHGPLFPANVHSLAPLFSPAAGGSLLLGVGGDEVLGNHYWTRLNAGLAGRRPVRARDALRLAAAIAPRPVRAAHVFRRHRPADRGWLLPYAARRVHKLERRMAGEPLRFDRAVVEASRSKALAVVSDSLRRLGDEAGVFVQSPLLAPRFVAALGRAGGARGWGDRSATVRAIAGSALPEAVLNRRDKAVFTAVFFGEQTRTFARTWSGQGLDESLLDVDMLRREWLSDAPDFRSSLLLQMAWLHDHGAASDRRADPRRRERAPAEPAVSGGRADGFGRPAGRA